MRPGRRDRRTEIILVLDNIRSLYNVGSMFRTADGLGVSRIFLCGITGTPLQDRLRKVSLGAERTVAWEHAAQTWRVLEALRRQGHRIIGLERSAQSRPLPTVRPTFPLALVVGNEVRGLSQAIRSRTDEVVHIPMYGSKESFNVSVACGIALYHFRYPAPLHR
ncbi:hypothetical protein AMJ57_00980 [Parcubacteria bacterium SG8_24]|nr:MAG: hypothetical protein AMJ57_00980 [Parcubacteria bacterium SG8_24]